jgi:phosphatidylserine/phosphatidylglycerophosphate/cardiolipin synthase-like enzyme
MPAIKTAAAWGNGEVAYIAWAVNERIHGCLGFMITRIHETGADKGERRILPTWIAFTDQSNPQWEEQDTSVWPIQNFQWRDLTLRKSRNTTNVRPIDFKVHYEIVPVGLAPPGKKIVPASATASYADANGKPRYEGNPRPLYIIGTPTVTNTIAVTHKYAKNAEIEATFTNGILSTQNLLKQLESVDEPPKKPKPAAAPAANPVTEGRLLAKLKKHIADEKSPIRAFLTGDVLSFLRRFLDEVAADGGEVYLALYELHDPELISLLESCAKKRRVRLILSTAGNLDPNPRKTPPADRQPVAWDVENNDPRAALHGLAANRISDRMLNNSRLIGHNKFAVYVKDGKARAVLTGSTNWTETGLCTQSNNSIIINNEAVADLYLQYWKRLGADKQPDRVALQVTDAKGKVVNGAAANNADQGKALRTSNAKAFGPVTLADGKATVELWCSPNTGSGKRDETSPTPGDLSDVYWLMNHADKAIFFLTFLPGESGRQNIIGEAARLAEERPDLLVLGAISDPTAMPNYKRVPPGAPDPDAVPGPDGKPVKLPPPAIWWPGGDRSRIAMIRAAAVRIPVGNLRPELLTAGHAIIHDKIIVIDPLDKDKCAVITGSHNLGYKASYSNDENLLIIRRNRELAISYAVHVLDIYDHYLFRAKLEDQLRETLKAGKQPEADPGHGFLRTDDTWQDRYFASGRPKTSLEYFLEHA